MVELLVDGWRPRRCVVWFVVAGPRVGLVSDAVEVVGGRGLVQVSECQGQPFASVVETTFVQPSLEDATPRFASGELDVHFSLEMEQHIFEDIKKADDPIALATFWSYAKYNPRYMKRVSEEINLMLGEKLRSIRDMGSILQYKEFWYVIIFNKCPYISKGLQYRYDGLIRNMLNSKGESSSQKTIRLIAGFMLDPNEPKSFISWNVYGAKMLQEITFRTHRKTIFRKGNSSIVASL